jgi:Ran GTPase-activating protein (RanGAP) involved in mRNA processing and transport/tRNA A-37 threonylcarbamoyl transferase component Bud32
MDMTGNNIGDAGAKSFAEAFKVNAAISWVDLSNNGIGPGGSRSLAEALVVNAMITSMRLAYNSIGPDGAAHLAGAFELNNVLATVDLGYNAIGDAGASALAEAIKLNTALTSVGLAYNSIGPDGAAHLANALQFNYVLASAELSFNAVGDAGASSLAEAIKLNAALTSVKLKYNSIGPSGAASLAEAFKVNTAVTVVDLGSNRISDTGTASLANAFMNNTAVVSVNLRDNDIGFAGAVSLAEVLTVNNVIERIDLSSNSIGDAGVATIIEALKANSAVTTAQMDYNPISSEWASALAWMVDNAGLRTIAKCSGTGILSQSSGKCQCSGVAVLGTGPACSDVVCTAEEVGLAARKVNALEIPKRCTHLNLKNATMLNDGAAALVLSLKANTVVTSVDLGFALEGTGTSTATLPIAAKWARAIVWLLDNVAIRSFAKCSGSGIISQPSGECQCSGLAVLGTGPACSDVVCTATDMYVGMAKFQGNVGTLVIPARCTEIDLDNNAISNIGAAALADALAGNTLVTTLRLASNQIGDRGAAALARRVKSNAVITVLSLADNPVGPKWTDAIGWLVANAGVRSVARCSGSGIFSEASGACQCSGLDVLGTGLTCSGVVCTADDFELAAFQDGGTNALVIPSRCIEVDLHNSSLFDDDVAALAWALMNNTLVTRVGLGSNEIGDGGAASLVNLFAVNTAIAAVDLSDNRIGNEGAARLKKMLESTISTATIDLRGNLIGSALMAALQCYAPHTPNTATGLTAVLPCSGGTNRTQADSDTGGSAAAAVGIALTAVALAVGLFCYVLRTRQQGSTARAAAVVSKFVAFARERAEARFVLEYRQLVNAKSMAAFQRELQLLEVPRSTVRSGVELGRGQSGVVFRGTLTDRGADVAIKTRVTAGFDVGGAAAVADEALMLEAMLLNGLRHPGIVALLAVVTSGAPVLICTELMQNGDLRDYLRACRPSRHLLSTSARAATCAQATITPQVVVAVAAKLGSAMAFLEQQRIIHRDIAARNVLVGKDATDVKMADLGAARNVHRTSELVDGGVYVATTDHTPARWMSLEALRHGRFSHASDVFAFGVLLWEVLSLGQTPWGVFGVSDFSQALANGERLPFPPAFEQSSDEDGGTAQTVYAVALRCWKENPLKRPHFHQLEAELAVHHTVLSSAVAATTPCDGPPGGVEQGRSEARIDGYLVVGGSSTEHNRAVLDSGGYVADTDFYDTPDLDCAGYVLDAGHNRERAHGQDRQQQSILDVVGRETDAASSDVFQRNGIAARGGRKPSLYRGFEQGSSNGGGLLEDETRL